MPLTKKNQVTLPTLYKRTSTGATQRWTVKVFVEEEAGREIAVIKTRYGQVDGATQEATELVREGKNIGRANETTPLEQAKSQAQSMWNKKTDKGYLSDRSKIDTGGKNADVKPMLAKEFGKRERFLEEGQEVFVQPKLDGIRCIAKKFDDRVELFTRNAKPITAVPHIIEQLNDLMDNGDIWDGELYHCDLEFNDITAFVRPSEPAKGGEIVEYHVFDTVDPSRRFEERFIDNEKVVETSHIKIVPTYHFEYDKDLLEEKHDEWVKLGYEGAIVRLVTDAGYEQKRTSNLLKFKKFMDAEFTIVGYEEGTPGSKLDGCLAAFHLAIECDDPDRETFKAKPDGSHDFLAQLWQDREEWVGKVVTVTFQNYSKYGVPRFPIIKGLRWEEDMSDG